jgi:hypothetical protein
VLKVAARFLPVQVGFSVHHATDADAQSVIQVVLL